ncbi:mRNA-decapping enzyme subunit 2 [Tulasnella sp. 419]|nr:mRNA-decapping enzyme subunit 2 [Tulasnella sp. 419]
MSTTADPPPNPPPPPLKKTVKKKVPLPKLPPSSFSFANASIDMILEDLSTRFILNLPDSELMSVERVCFQVEQAHWYYEDFVRSENTTLPSMPLRNFSAKLFAACPLLQRWSHRHEEAFAEFLKYKTSVPVCGAILLNDTWDKCVLVKGWKSNAPWSFPRGKINQNEPLHECAAREVLEETGFDCKGRLLEDQYITIHSKDSHTVTLFVVPNVPEDFAFNTRTRKEISKIDWFPLSQLPGWGLDVDDANWGTQRNGGASTSTPARPIKTWNISAFLAQLKRRLREFQLAFAQPNQTPSDSSSITTLSTKANHTPRRANAKSARHQQTPSYSEHHPKSKTQTHISVTSRGHDGRNTPDVKVQVDMTTNSGSGNETDELSAGAGRSTNNESSSQSSVDPVTPSSSAVDALFSRSNLLLPAQPAVTTQPAVVKKSGPKTPSKGKGRAPQSQGTGEVEGPKVNEDEDKSHMNNLMQSLFKSSLTVSPNTSSETEVPPSSGLPTPAESPVLPKSSSSPAPTTKSNKSEQRPSRRSRTTTTTTVTVTSVTDGNQSTPEPAPVKSMFDFVSPFDAFEPPPAPALPTPSTTDESAPSNSEDESNVASRQNELSSEDEDQLLSAPSPFDRLFGRSTSPANGVHVPNTLNAPAPGVMRSLSRNASFSEEPSVDSSLSSTPARKESESSSVAPSSSQSSAPAMIRQPSLNLDRHLALLQSVADEVDRSSQQSQNSSREQSRPVSVLSTPKLGIPLDLNNANQEPGMPMNQGVVTPMASSTQPAVVQSQILPHLNGNLRSAPGFVHNGSGSPFVSQSVPLQTQQHTLLHQHTPQLHHIPPNIHAPPTLPPTMVSPIVPPPHILAQSNGLAVSPSQGRLTYGVPNAGPGFAPSPAMAPHPRSISGSFTPNVPGLAALRGPPISNSPIPHTPGFGMNARPDLAAYPYGTSSPRPISSMSSISASSASSANQLRSPFVPQTQAPNPNSFTVQQKSPTDRNQLLNMFNKTNKPMTPVGATSNMASPSSPLAVLLGKGSPAPNTKRVPSTTGKPAIPVDDGFGLGGPSMMVPANVQFRNMMRKPSTSGAVPINGK